MFNNVLRYNDFDLDLDWERLSDGDTVDYYWQIANLESRHWGLVIYNQIVTWTAFAILAMFLQVSCLHIYNSWKWSVFQVLTECTMCSAPGAVHIFWKYQEKQTSTPYLEQSMTSRLETSRYWDFFQFFESISISLDKFGLKKRFSLKKNCLEKS